MFDWSKIDTILWDIDGTLLDFDAAEYMCFKLCLEKQGLSATDAEVARYKDINLSYWKRLEKGEVSKEILYPSRFRDWFEEMGFDNADPVKMNEDYQKALGEHPILRVDTINVLRTLKEAGFRQYAVTNGSSVAQGGKLDGSGIGKFFDGVFISEEIGVPKPQMEYFDFVKDKTRYRNDTTVIIGDSLSSDIYGGNIAEIATVWFNPKEEINNSGLRIDAEVKTLSEILMLLKVN